MKDNKLLKKSEKIILILYFFLVAFLPIILKAKKIFFVSPILEPSNMQTGYYINLFTQTKFSFLITVAFLIFIAFLFYLWNQKKIILVSYDYFFIFFTILVLFSFYFSEYKSVALTGTYNRPDGTMFYIILIILTLMISKIKINNKTMDYFSYMLYPFILINSLIGYLFIKRYPIMKNSFFEKYILGSEVVNITGFINSTLENPNYLSGFSGFLLVYFFTRFLFLNKIRIFDAIATILTFFILLSSFSSSGLLSASISILIGVLFFNKSNYKNFIRVIFIIPLMLFLLNFVINSDLLVKQEMLKLFEILKGNMIIIIIAIIILLSVLLLIKKYISYDKIKYISSGIVSIIILFSIFMTPFSEFYQKSFPDKVYYYDEIYEIVESKEIKSDSLSNRVFPWISTIDLIKERPFLGYGLGTFAMEYNSRSIFIPTSKWPPNILFDKPHNTFLEIAFGSGIISLIFFFLMFFNLFLQGLEKLRDNFDPRNLAIFLGMISFLSQALVNDSNVGTYPVMFIFFGILISRFNNNQDVPQEVIDNGKKKTKHKSN